MLERDPTADFHIRNRAIGPLSDENSYLSSHYTISSSVSASNQVGLFFLDAPGFSLRAGRGGGGGVGGG